MKFCDNTTTTKVLDYDFKNVKFIIMLVYFSWSQYSYKEEEDIEMPFSKTIMLYYILLFVGNFVFITFWQEFFKFKSNIYLSQEGGGGGGGV